MENLVSISIEIVDFMPTDLESRLNLPENIAFASSMDHFLAFSEICEYRIEYHEGFIISFHDNIFGQMFNHERIVFNFLLIIGNFIRFSKLKWEVLPSNVLIYIHLQKPCAYKPDASIFKEKPQLIRYQNPKDQKNYSAGLNPYAVFEVLSPSTERYDLNEKLANYKKIVGLEQIIFAKKDEMKLIVWEKIAEQWFENTYTNPNEVIFVAECPILMADLYENVDFTE